MFGLGYLDLYFLSSWLPTILHDAGVSVRNAVTIAAIFQVGGAIGAVLLGRLMDKFDNAIMLGCAFVVGSLCVFLIGAGGSHILLLQVAVLLAGSGIVGGLIGLTALTAQAYPTAIRSTGIGWAIGIGRIGSILGPMLGGTLLSLNWTSKTILQFASIPALLAAFIAFCIHLLVRRQVAEPNLAASANVHRG
jgi:AAHS family 4-hydroxybenzoate transporter-like MFS transporter